jgi:hypothetical protein
VVVVVVVLDERAEVVGEGARWSEVGQGVIVVVVGERSGMGWLSEVREMGWGEVVIVIVMLHINLTSELLIMH